MNKKLIVMMVCLLTAGLIAGYPALLTAGLIVGYPPALVGEAQQVEKPRVEKPRNVIFFHPDGYALNHWNTLRYWLVGPDGKLNWDRLPYIAPYTGHMKDALTGSSHGGATVHAYGVKVVRDSFGLDGEAEITALSGKKMSIMEEAIAAGFATALIQTGCITEPGTAAFVASVKERGDHAEIAKQVIESGVDVILSGGESWLLPEGVRGRHGKGERKDGLNLIERAKGLGYTVVYTRDELKRAAADPEVVKLLGVFASKHTFNDLTEEELRARGLPLYWPEAPTIAEMAAATLQILARHPKAAAKGFFIVAEEEGTDNFGNASNARGSFEAGKRTDEAFGVFVDFVEKNPNTLLITAADSDAGAKNILGPDPGEMKKLLRDGKLGETSFNTRPDGKWAMVPLDGVDGAGTEPFMSAPDKAGKRWQFAITWVRHDVSGGILARAMGLNAELVSKLGRVDNTDIYRIMYYTLFGKWLGEPRAGANELVARAIIPADTFVLGPTSGKFIGEGPINNRIPPFVDRQPVQGISALVPLKDGSFLAMSDNGFGRKDNSADYLLAVYKIRPDFAAGTVKIEEVIRLRDPYRKIPFRIQNENTIMRYLTGADFDLESFQVAPDGTFWFGDEFGPFLLQTDARGIVLRAPIPLPDVKSPDHPLLGKEKPTLPRSGGFEGMALSADGTKLYPMLERALIGDKDQKRRIIYEFDLKTQKFTGKEFYYRVEDPKHAIGELVTIDGTRLLVIERDDKEGKAAAFKKLFQIDLTQKDADGYLHKKEVADLLRLADPRLISWPGRPGDIGLGETFSFPFWTIEAVAIVAPDILVLTNDNNYPFSTGRNRHHPDDTEIIKIRLATPLRP